MLFLHFNFLEELTFNHPSTRSEPTSRLKFTTPRGALRYALAMNTLSPKKQLRSKWTAVTPSNKEKHFIVTAVIEDDDPALPPAWIDIEAVHSGVTRRIAWRDLRDGTQWLQGWA